MDKQYVTGRVKAIDTEARTLTAYASTADLDRDGDVILPEAWSEGLNEFESNPVLLWAHDYRVPPVGKAMDLEIDDRGLKFTASFARTEFADEVWGLYRDGFLNAFSVGFQPKAWEEREDTEGLTFTETQLMEISAVPVPANPHALIERGVPVISVKSPDSIAGVPTDDEPEAEVDDQPEANDNPAPPERSAADDEPEGEEPNDSLSEVDPDDSTTPDGGQATRPDDESLVTNPGPAQPGYTEPETDEDDEFWAAVNEYLDEVEGVIQ